MKYKVRLNQAELGATTIEHGILTGIIALTVITLSFALVAFSDTFMVCFDSCTPQELSISFESGGLLGQGGGFTDFMDGGGDCKGVTEPKKPV